LDYVVQCTLSRKSSLSEKSERDFPTSEREKYFGVASGSTRDLLLEHAIVEGVRSVCLSVCHTRELCLCRSKCRNTFHTVR